MIDPINGAVLMTAGTSNIPSSNSSRADSSNISGNRSSSDLNAGKRTAEVLDEINIKSKESIERTIQALKDFVESNNHSLKIQVHQGTGSIIIKVISEKDGSVIREIPPEKLQDLVQNIKDFSGSLFNKNA